MKIRVLLFSLFCAISLLIGCRRVDHYLHRKVASSQCNIISQSPLAGMSYAISGDSLMFTHDWTITHDWTDYTDVTRVKFRRINDTIEVRGLSVVYRDGQELSGWDSIDVAYNIILNAEGKAMEFYSLENPDDPARIEYESGRVKRIASQAASGIANFTYDDRGNAIEIVADDVTSLSHKLTYEYGQDTVLYNVPIHPTIFFGYEFFTMQVMGWVPPLAKYQKTKSIYFDREAQQIIHQVDYANYNTDLLGRITSFEANGEKVRLGWQCKIPALGK